MAPLPPIPAKRYFTISEVALLCDVKPHVLRYWEQEFVQLRPMKRRGNRRYYQHHELLMVRRIRSLLYDEGFTIQGARNQLRSQLRSQPGESASLVGDDLAPNSVLAQPPQALVWEAIPLPDAQGNTVTSAQLRQELLQIRSLLSL
ncbi:MerR family transcriptional regulator [Comamonas sp. GB3 AK4-5]|uniref:MerR family transcriptional regulator n=1 Tax=Comamonas sp. GB3 AK4-5 TaxID=3231487 RepID=UPI00351F3ED8